MAKWKSALFSDIRNKLGDQVVFSMWKGRPYFRTHVTPANPQTDPQQAERNQHREIVERFQQEITTDEINAVWDELALPYQISGYNLFLKAGRRSYIEVPSTASGSVSVTYWIGTAIKDPGIFREAGDGTLTDVTPTDLKIGEEATLSDSPSSGDDFTYWIAERSALTDGDSAPQSYQAYNSWSPDPTNGEATQAITNFTV